MRLRFRDSGEPRIFPQELPLLLSAAGLELISRFGELSRAPFGPGSRVQVCLCRRQA